MEKSNKTHTFGELRAEIFRLAGVNNHFELCRKGGKYETYWEKLNSEEYSRGYKRGEYEESGTSQLCDMPLLSHGEYNGWIAEFYEIDKIAHHAYSESFALKSEAPEERPIYHSLSDVIQNGSSEDVVSYLAKRRDSE